MRKVRKVRSIAARVRKLRAGDKVVWTNEINEYSATYGHLTKGKVYTIHKNGKVTCDSGCRCWWNHQYWQLIPTFTKTEMKKAGRFTSYSELRNFMGV